MDDVLERWLNGLPPPESARLTQRVSAVGTCKKDLGPKFEFAMVYVTIDPSEELKCVDNVPCREELQALGVSWPQSVVFGMLDVLMLMEPRSLYRVQITLDDAAYHEVDSSESAFREAGRDAGRKIVEAIRVGGLLRDR